MDYAMSGDQAGAFAAAGPQDRPLAEWTMAEYGAALELAGLREPWRQEYEKRAKAAQAVLDALARPRRRRWFGVR